MSHNSGETLTRTFHFFTFGCQMNKLDSELAAGELARAGMAEAETAEEADVILFNTCSVRQHAEDKVYSNLGALRARKRRDPHLVIGVIGCVAQREGERIFERMPHVDLVCGTRMFLKLPDLIKRVCESRDQVLAIDEDQAIAYRRSTSCRPDRFRAFVSVMRGCDNWCAYCVVPALRGPEVSRPIADVVAEVRRLAEDGCREVTLLGQNINSYGKRLRPRATLAELVAEVNGVEGIERIRFVTSHPKDMSDEMLRAVADLDKVCENIHLPAQSGSNRILGAMKRRYTAERYREIIAKAREWIPEVTFASDFIVGFPGETEEDFQDTVRLVRDCRFQNSFIFKYSPRPGTAAAELPDDVPMKVKKARNQELLRTQEEVSRELNDAMIGREIEVLVEGPSKSDKTRLVGRTRRNHIVVFTGLEDLTGTLRTIRITDATPLTLFGDLVD
ncbi:MAG: tRNA (N6-isopentenyl adenosine(37)-C2)-methylthiotransferase MiaB [Planctomycetes bacterium]|nr:tRNA (N6-isopentenyl adenosine(37)-C2)-methylthiotransferase MiaB [Planctomycetota bacterium]